MNSTYLKAIQTAVIYQKNTYNMFRPNFLFSCLVTKIKNKSLGKTDY